MLAVTVCVGVVLAGVYLLLTPDAADLAVFAWMFVVLGALGAVANLVLRARTRRARPGPATGRRS